MNELHGLTNLEKPLTKSDFLKFRYEVRKDIYSAITYVTGSGAIVLIAMSIYNFFTGSFYSGIVKIVIAAIAIAMCREAYQDWAAESKKIDVIEKKMQKS